MATGYSLKKIANPAIALAGLVLVLTSALLWTLWGMLTPFITAFLMAYILSPLVSRLEKRGVPRWVSSLILMMGFFAFIFELFFILVPFVEQQLLVLFDALPFYGEHLLERLQPLWEKVQIYTPFKGDVTPLKDILAVPLRESFRLALNFIFGIWRSGSALASFLSLLFFAPLMTFHFLRDWDRVLLKANALIPLSIHKTLQALFKDIDRALGNYARGQLMVCTVLALYYTLGLYAVGAPFYLSLGLVSGFLIFIPYIGFFSGLTLSLLVALMASGRTDLFIAIPIVYGFGQFLEGVLLTPFFVGGRTGLHPLWILFALFASAALFGLVGVVFCLPLAAVCRVLVSWLVTRYWASSFYRGVA
jgi:predicted PurR-regulated permease PerM